MKELDELILPEDIRFSRDHEWVRSEADQAVIGISDYAQDQLGDIVFVELPETGTALEKDQVFGSVESVKSVSELFMPVAATVVEVNTALEDSPELVNSDPYGQGWMLKVRPSDPTQVDTLLDRAGYLAILKE
jgi:glycine cleavage system H protein